MKKIIYIAIAIVASFVMASCEKDPIGGSAVQDMSGEWYVTCDLMTAGGEVFATGADFFGLDDRFMILTYNTAADKDNELFVDDMENFWAFQCVTSCNLQNLTFTAADAEDLLYGDTVTLSGKIVKNGTTTPSGAAADYIEIDVTFGSDEYPAEYGYDHYRLSGWRYTGFANDD